jgi:hypothetical protein
VGEESLLHGCLCGNLKSIVVFGSIVEQVEIELGGVGRMMRSALHLFLETNKRDSIKWEKMSSS